jgi:hypothetical protein
MKVWELEEAPRHFIPAPGSNGDYGVEFVVLEQEPGGYGSWVAARAALYTVDGEDVSEDPDNYSDWGIYRVWKETEELFDEDELRLFLDQIPGYIQECKRHSRTEVGA